MAGRSPGRRPPLRVLAVYKKSSYDIYVRERKHVRVQQLLDDGDRSVRNFRRAHERHKEALQSARETMAAAGVKATFRHRSGPVGDEDFDLIVTLGGDGTLLWASHLAGKDLPMLAINTAPEDSVGFFAAGDGSQLADLLSDAQHGRLAETRLTRMRVDLDGERVSDRVLNDILFAHHNPAATTRFGLKLGDGWADYKSSGLWVCTSAGSTGAMASAGGRPMRPGSRRLQFKVREPYVPAGPATSALQGFVQAGEQLEIVSHIRTARLYMDGPREVRPVDIGSQLKVAESEEPLSLLGFRRTG